MGDSRRRVLALRWNFTLRESKMPLSVVCWALVVGAFGRRRECDRDASQRVVDTDESNLEASDPLNEPLEGECAVV
jgi:hypothetical protein